MLMISTNSKPIEIKKWYTKWRKEQVGKGHILDKSSPILLTTWYAEKVLKGDIIACEKVKLACKRHINDLKKQGTEDFPYIFVEEKGHRPIRFVEKYCKPSKGDFKQLTMQPWQHFTIGSVYGWVHMETGYRRFRESLEFVGRKNGKTTRLSGGALYASSKDDEQGARCYILANTKQQAGELFDESRAMVQASPALRKRLRENQKGIFHDASKSKIESRASDSKKLDGLNTHFAAFDEIHEFRNFKLINVIKRSWSARKQPLVTYITTAGYELDGPLIEYYEVSIDVLNGVINQDRKFYFMCELDDEKEILNPEMWIKANPNIGVTLNLPELVEDFNTDKHIPQEYADWVTKQFNIFVKNDELSFLSYEVLKRNKKEIDINDLNGMSCIGGFDLSTSEDFTSACLEFLIHETGEVFVLSHSWIPRKKVLEDSEKIPYLEWAKDGLLTICDGEYIDYAKIYDWFVEQSKRFNIDLITYDTANAFLLVKELEAAGFETKVVRQGHITLSPALKNAKELFIDGNVITNNNKLFRWYVNNVKLVEDRLGNWMPTKQNRYRKIDGFAAFLNSHSVVFEMMGTPSGSGDIEFISVNDL